MSIQEQTTASSVSTQHVAEWTARELHPVARWVSVPTGGGPSRLEMVWSVPDPSPADALRLSR